MVVLRAARASNELGGQGRPVACDWGREEIPSDPGSPSAFPAAEAPRLVEPEFLAGKETCLGHFPESGPTGAAQAHELPAS